MHVCICLMEIICFCFSSLQNIHTLENYFNLRFTNHVLSSVAIMYFVLIILAAGSVSVSMFRVSTIYIRSIAHICVCIEMRFQILNYF